MVQFAGGVTAVQLKLMPLEEAAVAVSPVGADGTVVHELPPPLSGNWMEASMDCFSELTGVAS